MGKKVYRMPDEYTITDKITHIKELSAKDLKAVNNAIKIAETSLFNSSKRLGAYIKGNECVLGENQYRQRYGKHTTNMSLHAEMNVLFKTMKIYKKSNRLITTKSKFRHNYNELKGNIVMYVIRLMKSDKSLFGNAKPCNCCQKTLRLYNVKKVKYSDNINGQDVIREMKI